MKALRRLTIYRRLFYRADCYTRGTVQQNSGVQVHCTSANNPYLHRYVQPDDGRIGPNRYNNSHNRPNITVCASAYIGKQADGTVAVYQALPWDRRCWLSGSGSKGKKNNANHLGYAGFEICADGLTDKAYFEAAVMNASVCLTAYLCNLYGVGIDKVRDHSELHGMGLASNHADISHWLKKYGLNMNDYRAAVQAAMKEGVEVEYIECDDQKPARATIRKGSRGEDVVYLQTCLLNLGYRLPEYGADGSFGNETFVALKAFQVISGLTADGVCGPATWKAVEDAVKAKEQRQQEAATYTVTISGLDAATATYLLETYPGAVASENIG